MHKNIIIKTIKMRILIYDTKETKPNQPVNVLFTEKKNHFLASLIHTGQLCNVNIYAFISLF